MVESCARGRCGTRIRLEIVRSRYFEVAGPTLIPAMKSTDSLKLARGRSKLPCLGCVIPTSLSIIDPLSYPDAPCPLPCAEDCTSSFTHGGHSITEIEVSQAILEFGL